jgi:hypothetical protein
MTRIPTLEDLNTICLLQADAIDDLTVQCAALRQELDDLRQNASVREEEA